MKKQSTLDVKSAVSRSSSWEHALAMLILVGTAMIPFVMSWHGEDHFRLPQQLFLIGLAIAGTVVLGAGLLLGRIAWPSSLTLPSAIAGAGLAWMVISTVTSTDRGVSSRALVWGASVTALFLAATVALRHVAPKTLAVALLFPGVVNSILVLLQTFNLWNPWSFAPGMPQRLMRNALLGNPNDVGAYLAFVTLLAVAMFLESRSWPYALIAIVAGAGILATETLTAIVALTAAFLVMLAVVHPRYAAMAGLTALPLVISGLLLYGPTQQRWRAVERSVRAGAWGEVMSGRLPAFLVAWEMFRDHPLLGTGPGTFKSHYLTYYQIIEERYPRAVVGAPAGTIFAETHNDHLQLLAETGLPGYLFVTSGITMVAIRAARRKRGIARLLALPAATLLMVLMLASFPLQLAAPLSACLAMSAAALAWSDDA